MRLSAAELTLPQARKTKADFYREVRGVHALKIQPFHVYFLSEIPVLKSYSLPHAHASDDFGDEALGGDPYPL